MSIRLQFDLKELNVEQTFFDIEEFTDDEYDQFENYEQNIHKLYKVTKYEKDKEPCNFVQIIIRQKILKNNTTHLKTEYETREYTNDDVFTESYENLMKNPIIHKSETDQYIPLLISIQDVSSVLKKKWHMQPSTHKKIKYYVIENERSKSKKEEQQRWRLSRHIMYGGNWEQSVGDSDEYDADHLNGNTLNNTRSNVKVKHCAQNASNVQSKKDLPTGITRRQASNGEYRYRTTLYGFGIGTYGTVEEAEKELKKKEGEVNQKIEANHKLPKEQQRSIEEVKSEAFGGRTKQSWQQKILAYKQTNDYKQGIYEECTNQRAENQGLQHKLNKYNFVFDDIIIKPIVFYGNEKMFETMEQKDDGLQQELKTQLRKTNQEQLKTFDELEEKENKKDSEFQARIWLTKFSREAMYPISFTNITQKNKGETVLRSSIDSNNTLIQVVGMVYYGEESTQKFELKKKERRLDLSKENLKESKEKK